MRDITVLVADDEATVRQYLATVILREKLPVSELLEADNGLDALALARASSPDLIFLDIRMPGQDGLETAKQLMHEGFPGKIVIISAYNEFDYAQRALRVGATDYLLKPIKPADFSEIILGVAGSEKLAESPPVFGEATQHPGEARQPALARSVLAHIAAHLSAPLRLEDIAKAVHVSPWHLSRTFKRLTGKSIADCVRETRVERAKEILLATDFSVTEVAGMVGFENAGYFSTCFKQMTGASPSEFRKARESGGVV